MAELGEILRRDGVVDPLDRGDFSVLLDERLGEAPEKDLKPLCGHGS